MRYLKTYESVSIEDDLKDILLDIEDIGYKTKVDELIYLPYPRTIGSNKKEISITIQEPENDNPSSSSLGGDSRKESDVLAMHEVIERVNDYMRSHKWILCKINKKEIKNGVSDLNTKSDQILGKKVINWKTQLILTLYISGKVTLYYKPM